MTNLEHLRAIVCSRDYYRIANILMNIADYDCDICPRRVERCNEDCNNGICEWLLMEYDPSSVAWKDC